MNVRKQMTHGIMLKHMAVGKKLFIVQKYIRANNAAEAIRKEKKHAPDEVYLDSDGKKNQELGLNEVLGFKPKK